MTTTQILILVAVMAIAVVVALIVINYLNLKDERDNTLVKYVLLFDKKTKKFSEQRSDDFEEEEDVVMIAINNDSVLHSFNRYCAAECYHVTTVYQARRVFDIYLKSRINVN